MEEILSEFDDKMLRVAKTRGGIGTRRRTLQSLGDEFGVTRERVRQIEERFWKKAMHISRRHRFAEVFVCDLISRGGSMVASSASPEGELRKFIAKAAGVPYTEWPQTGLLLFGYDSGELQAGSRALVEDMEPQTIAKTVEELSISTEDIQVLTEAIAEIGLTKRTKRRKTYLALREIGRPAHFSAVHSKYLELFPSEEMSERAVHALLGYAEGVVWTGAKGNYALKEWGYERPAKGLYESVAEVVARKYAETKAPVPVNVVLAEIGKYRQVVNPVSVSMVLQLSPEIRMIAKDTYAPRYDSSEIKHESDLDGLAVVLREFEDDQRGGGSTQEADPEDGGFGTQTE